MSDARTWFDSEVVFLFLVAAFAIWIYVESDNYSSAGSMYPQLSAATVLGLLAVLVVVRILPTNIQERITSSSEAIEYGSTGEDRAFSTRNVVIVTVLFALYIGGVYLLGFLLATVPYVYGSLVALGYSSRWRRLALTVFISLIVVLGYVLLGIPWTFGRLFELIPVI
ncbi:tripartite tricarboxylate transporter TctB family protein [Natrialbaceae archaeon A-CW3]